MLDVNDLTTTKIIITGDMDAEKIRELVAAAPFIYGFGVGTKLAAETVVAGVIFKLCEIDYSPTMKLSAEENKKTIAGRVQIFRCENKEGIYVMDIIATADEPSPCSKREQYDNLPEFCNSIPLIHDFWGIEKPYYQIPPIENQKNFVNKQIEKFGGKKGLYSYPIVLSPTLQERINLTAAAFQDDPNLKEGIIPVPE
jgi:hypothetical protein